MACAGPSLGARAPSVDGKFLSVDGERFLVKGVSYGTFAPRADGSQYPAPHIVADDFRMMRQHGINTVRIYTPPPLPLLDQAARHGLRVMIGLPWTQHVAFLDDRRLRQQIRAEIVKQLRAFHDHPAALLFALGNEIPTSVVRWHGHRAVENFLRELYEEAKSVAPGAIVTYVNYPPTEYLDIPFFDVCAFNVYLHDERSLREYLARTQHIAGQKPLLIAEAGADSMRQGVDGQGALVAMQLRTAFREGACGAIAFAWTDEWWRGGAQVDDWAFGLVDAKRRPKPALAAASQVFASAPFDEHERRGWPKVSVVVCAHNAAATIDDCLSSLERLTYPDFEIIVVNDGSTDDTEHLARQHARVILLTVPKGGLSHARNLGIREATGEIVAFCDSDAYADPQWLDFLVQPFMTSDVIGSGGPNVVPREDPWIAQCVARAPGAPTQVLLTDRIAEHVPGCNMAFRRQALLRISGFNPIYVRAGDDVDLCWRLQAECGPIGFAPAALVWHHHRASVRGYWRQQVGYGEGEEWLRPHHPTKFVGRRILWRGLVYSPLPFIRSLSDRRINCGVWGSAAFPSVYHVNGHALTYLPHSAGWQFSSMTLLVLGIAAIVSGLPAGAGAIAAGLVGCAVTAWRCLAHAWASDIQALPAIGRLSPRVSRSLYRLTIAWLHAIQPLARMHGRLRAWRDWPSAAGSVPPRVQEQPVPRRRIRDVVYLMTGASLEQRFWSESWTSSSDLLHRLVERLRASRVAAQIAVDDGWWTDRDVSIAIARGVSLDVRTLVEDHGAGKCLFRAGVRLRGAWLSAVTLFGVVVTASLAALAGPGALAAGSAAVSLLLGVALLRVVARAAETGVVLRDAVRVVAEQCDMFDPDHVASRIAPQRGTAARRPHSGAALPTRARRKPHAAVVSSLVVLDVRGKPRTELWQEQQ